MFFYYCSREIRRTLYQSASGQFGW